MPFASTTLIGDRVRLEPLTADHREPLREIARDERIWEWMLFDGSGPGFDLWFDDAVTQERAGRRISFIVRQKSDGRLIGTTSYLDILEAHKRVEIGSTWYVPEVWGTAVNPECKLLLLGHAFEVFGVNRVALVTDGLNQRSQAAITKLGAVREGVLRSHMISPGSRIRDSVFFSIIASEWPRTRGQLEARVKAHGRMSVGFEERA
jgi:RimJ/RimL family protein N-acetyltransferase